MSWPGTESDGVLAKAAATWSPFTRFQKEGHCTSLGLFQVLKYKVKLIKWKGVLTFTVQVWQTDVQIHFYFTSTVFVWVIHIELINSGGQKTQVGLGTELLSPGKKQLPWEGRNRRLKSCRCHTVKQSYKTERRKSPPQLHGCKSRFNFTSCLASAGGFQKVSCTSRKQNSWADFCFLPLSLTWISEALQTKNLKLTRW